MMGTVYWDSWQSFFHMGGYGPYVWGSYIFAAVALAWEAPAARRRLKRALGDAAARGSSR